MGKKSEEEDVIRKKTDEEKRPEGGKLESKKSNSAKNRKNKDSGKKWELKKGIRGGKTEPDLWQCMKTLAIGMASGQTGKGPSAIEFERQHSVTVYFLDLHFFSGFEWMVVKKGPFRAGKLFQVFNKMKCSNISEIMSELINKKEQVQLVNHARKAKGLIFGNRHHVTNSKIGEFFPRKRSRSNLKGWVPFRGMEFQANREGYYLGEHRHHTNGGVGG